MLNFPHKVLTYKWNNLFNWLNTQCWLHTQTCLIGLNCSYSSQCSLPLSETLNRSWPVGKNKPKTSSFLSQLSDVESQGLSESATFQGGCVGQPQRHLLTLRMVIMKQMHLLWHWLFHKRTAKQSASLTYAEYKECIGEAGSNWKKRSVTDTDLCYGSDCSITTCFFRRCIKEFKRKKEVFSVFKKLSVLKLRKIQRYYWIYYSKWLV